MSLLRRGRGPARASARFRSGLTQLARPRRSLPLAV